MKLLTVLRRCQRKSRYHLSAHSNFSLAQFIFHVVQGSQDFILHELDTEKKPTKNKQTHTPQTTQTFLHNCAILKCMEDNSLAQVVSEPTREEAPLDMLFASREELLG